LRFPFIMSLPIKRVRFLLLYLASGTIGRLTIFARLGNACLPFSSSGSVWGAERNARHPTRERFSTTLRLLSICLHECEKSLDSAGARSANRVFLADLAAFLAPYSRGWYQLARRVLHPSLAVSLASRGLFLGTWSSKP